MKKRLIYIAASLMAAGVMVSCHKITVKATSELTPDVFPQDSASYISAAGPAYVALRGNAGVEYFFQQTYMHNKQKKYICREPEVIIL